MPFDEAAELYEKSSDFFPEAVDAITAPGAAIPHALHQAIIAWYRDTDMYLASVQHVQSQSRHLA